MDRPRIPTELVELLESWRGVPVIVRDEHLDVLASNRLAREVSPGFSPGVNLARFTFLNSWTEDVTDHWADVSGQVVALLRQELEGRPTDDSFRPLIGDLAVRSEQFAAIWAGDRATPRGVGTVSSEHPLVGHLELTYQILEVPDYPGLALVVWTAEPGSASEAALDRLIAIVESEGG